MNPTALQLLVVAFGLFLFIKSISGGITIASLPLGWFISESMPNVELSLFIWLLTCLIFGFLVISHARNPKNNIQRQ